jgi:hypothetical protein
MTSTPARRNALVSILVLVATCAVTLALLRFDVLESQGPGTQAQAVLTDRADDDRAEASEIAEQIRSTSGDATRPTGRLDHAGYQQYFDWFQPWAAATLMEGIADGSGWSTAHTAASTAVALDPIIAELRTVQPPADVRAAHARLVESYVGYRGLLERLSRDKELQRQPARDMTPLLQDTPEVREMWVAAAAIKRAGYDTHDDRVDGAGGGETRSTEELIAETERIIKRLDASRAATTR